MCHKCVGNVRNMVCLLSLRHSQASSHCSGLAQFPDVTDVIFTCRARITFLDAIQYNSILKSSTLVGSGGVHGDLVNVLVFGTKDVVLAFGDPEIVVIRQSSISIAYQFSIKPFLIYEGSVLSDLHTRLG